MSFQKKFLTSNLTQFASMQKFFWHLQDHLIDFLGIEDTGNDQER